WNVAALAAGGGQAERAARLLGAAEALLRADGLPTEPAADDRPLWKSAIAGARARLGADAFAAAWAAGRAVTPDRAVAEARVAIGAEAAPASPTGQGPSTVHGGLTARELEVLRLVATGRSNREVAAALFISVPTVKRHLTTVLAKLGLPSRAALVAYAHTHGLA